MTRVRADYVQFEAVDAGPSLTPLQQMLLRTDGTLTPILEAYAGEPVQVVKLHQEFDVARRPDAPLELRGDSKVLRRQVLLRGGRTERVLLHADAVIATEQVEACLVEELLGTDKPIGQLLSEYLVETRRDILTIDRQPGGRYSAFFGLTPSAPMLFRTYRIVAGGRPIMLITERFPATAFLQLPGPPRLPEGT